MAKIRTNLALDPRLSKFGSAGAPGVVYNCTAAADTTVKLYGAQSVKISATAAVAYGVLWYAFLTYYESASNGYIGMPSVDTKGYIVKMKVRWSAGSGSTLSAALQLNWYVGSGQKGPDVPLVKGEWVDVYAFVPAGYAGRGTPISGVHYAQCYLVSYTGMTADTVMHAQALHIEEATPADVSASNVAAYPYFDGSLPPSVDGYHAWSGTAGASVSTETQPTYQTVGGAAFQAAGGNKFLLPIPGSSVVKARWGAS